MHEHSHVRIESPAFSPDTVHLIEVQGRETISQLFELHAQVVSSDPGGLDVDAVIGAPAVIVFERAGREVRRMGGLIAGIRDSMHEETGRMVYDLWFAPRAFRMGLVETYEIFMDLSVPDIVKKKLERAGLTEGDDFELRLTATYPAREFVVQYKETDLAFVSRLLEHVGVCFFFEHKDGKDVFILSDANSGFAPLPDKKEVPFRPRGERLGVFGLESHTKMTPGQYVVKDYNYRTPQVALQAAAPTQKGDGGFIMEYGAHFKDPNEGAQIAKIRAEELACGRTILDGRSDRHTFAAGAMFLLEEHPRGDMELLITEVQHHAATTALGTGKEDVRDYENTFRAIPYKTPYRPPRVTPKPRIHGVITGVIDAAAKGPYAELDPDGRYRVRFLFDAGDASDGQASRLCRMAQPHGGGGYGMHFPLRSGVEVILTFVEGDPDRPIILGVVPNPQTPSPVTAGNGTRNVIRTGGGNEINIDDTAGSERIKLSTPFGGSVIQMGQKNADEKGIILETSEHVSANSKETINFLSSTISGAGDYCRMKSAWDMTLYCTPWVNLASLTSAFLGAVKTGAEGATAAAGRLATAFDMEAREDWAKAAEEVAEKKEADARAKRKEIEAAKQKRDAATKKDRDQESTANDTLADKEKELADKRALRAQKQGELSSKEALLAAKEAQLTAKKVQREAMTQVPPAPPPAPQAPGSLFGGLFSPPAAPPPPPAAPDTSALDAEIAQIEKDIASLKTEVATLSSEISTLDSEIRALEKEVAELKKQTQTLEQQINKQNTPVEELERQLEDLEKEAEIAKRLADDRKKEAEESATGKYIKPVVDFAAGLKDSSLMSTISSLAGFMAQNEADGLVLQHAVGANTVSATGRHKAPAAVPMISPKFTGGATMDAALVARSSTFLGSGACSALYSGGTAAVVGGTAMLKGEITEVSGSFKVYVSSNSLIDIKSDAAARVETGTGDLTLTSGKDAQLTAKTTLTLNADEEKTKVVAKAQSYEVTVNEGMIKVEEKASAAILQMSKDGASLLKKDWGILAQENLVQIGNNLAKAPKECLWADPKEIGLKRGTHTTKLNDKGFAVDVAQTAIDLKSSNLTWTGTKLELTGTGKAVIEGSKIHIG